MWFFPGGETVRLLFFPEVPFPECLLGESMRKNITMSTLMCSLLFGVAGLVQAAPAPSNNAPAVQAEEPMVARPGTMNDERAPSPVHPEDAAAAAAAVAVPAASPAADVEPVADVPPFVEALNLTPEQQALYDAYMQAKAALVAPVQAPAGVPDSLQGELEQRLAVQAERFERSAALVKARGALVDKLSAPQRYMLDRSELGYGIGPVRIGPSMPAFRRMHRHCPIMMLP